MKTKNKIGVKVTKGNKMNQTMNDRINELEHILKELHNKYNEAMQTIWLLDEHLEAQELLKKHGVWGESTSSDKTTEGNKK
jgi:hypothetical protein